MSKKKKTTAEGTTSTKKEVTSPASPALSQYTRPESSTPAADSPKYYLASTNIEEIKPDSKRKKREQPAPPPEPPKEWFETSPTHNHREDPKIGATTYAGDSESEGTTESDDSGDEDQHRSMVPTTTVSPPPVKPRMAQAQIEARIRRAFVRKLDLNDKIADCTGDKIRSPYVNRSLWEHSGVIIRVYNLNVPDIPPEVGILRLRIAHTELIPAILARERPKIKSWALQQVQASLKEACHNIALDPKLSCEEWTMRYTVSSLSAYGQGILGASEPGLWVLHCPELIEEVILAKYEDGSEDKGHILKLYINLVKPEHRIRQIEGGWMKEDEPEEKKPKFQSNRPFARPYNPRFRQRPYFDQQEVAEKTAELLEARLNKVASLSKTEGSFPRLESSKNPNAVQSIVWPESDVPNISCNFN
jgi:hypothetical protein